MTVQCPQCQTRYLLPDHLLGPRGARVRCPGCEYRFDVGREGDAGSAESNPPASVVVAADSAPSGDDAHASVVARALLRSLAERLGERLAQARASGRVLSEFGPELMSAWDAYREQLGAAAPARPFRAELQAAWGVDLISGVE